MLPFLKNRDKSAGKDKAPFYKRLSQGLKRTRQQFAAGMADLVLGKKQIDNDLLEAVETQLLAADCGVAATKSIVQELTNRLARKQLSDAQALYQALQEDLTALLAPYEQPMDITSNAVKPYVILMVGVNGSGKTTTIGKLANYLQQQGKSLLLAAGDTFRAAAVEQLQVWGERNNVPVIAQQKGADSAAVIYDAVAAAKARNVDVVIADTAGRLHTQQGLMEELKKVKKVIAKCHDGAPHEVLLVLDAGIGQNTLQQAREFHTALGVTGICLSKLDGTAKGGILFALAQELRLPIRFIGVGEAIDDLRPFDAKEFVAALFEQDDYASECH